jgi:AcrB/AcrD/AcrF family/Barrel-sandwich domain of CusB or HlyD membrane-fusion
MNDLLNVPLNASNGTNLEILGDVASVNRGHEMGLITHYNIRRTIDIYGAVQDRDLGGVSQDVEKIVNANQKLLPRGTFISVRGQVQTMRSSYTGILLGLGLAVILVYMLIVVNFQSWLDPFIIITALPAALTGIVLCLFLTHTRLSVPALMGALMCMGIATANSILVVSFAKDRLREHGDTVRAAIEAGATRFRPVVMTALAMVIGMVPMALGLGEGGEQTHPGETATLTLDAFPGETFIGTVVRNSNSIDLTSRTLNVEVDVDNATGRLLPGAYAFVHLKLPAMPGAVTIPTNALLFRAEGLRVAAVRNGEVKLVPITIGHDYGSTVEVTSNLTANDSVIIDPSDSIMDGARVEIGDSSQARVAVTKTR